MEIISTILNVLFYALPAFIVFICVLAGAKKGLALSIVKVIRVAVSIGLALLLTRILVSSAHETIQSGTTDLVGDSAEFAAILESAPSLMNYVTIIVSYLVAPILFLPVYLVVTLLMLIPGGIAKHIVKKKNIEKQRDNSGAQTEQGRKNIVRYKKTAPLSWLWGMLIGLATGVMISAAILMPFANYLDKANVYIDKLEASGIVKDSESFDQAATEIRSSKENVGVQIITPISSPLFDALTTYETTESVKVSVFKDLDFVLDIMPDITQLMDNMKGINEENFADIDLEPLKNVVSKLKNTGNLKVVIVELLSNAGTNWSTGNEFLGVNMANVTGEFSTYANIAFNRLAAMTVEDVDASLDIVNEFVDAIGAFAKAIGKVGELLDTDFSDISSITVNPVKDVSDILATDGNDLARNIVATLLSDAGTKWKNSEQFMGLNIKDSLPTGYKNSLDKALKLLAETTKDTVCKNLNTFADAINTIKNTYVYVNSAIDPDATMGDLQQNLTEVLSSLTPESVDIVMGAISDQMLTDLGMSDDTSAAIANTLENVLQNVAELSDEEKAAEAAAMNDIITYVSDSSAQTAEPEQLVDSVLNSTVVSNEILNLADSENENQQNFEVDQDQKDSIDAAIDGYINDPEKDLSEEDIAVLEALRSLFTVQATAQP